MHHAAVVHRHHRANLAALGGQGQVVDLGRALDHVDMRVFFKGDNDVGRRHQLPRQRTMQVQFDTDHHVLADRRADGGGQIALAIVIAFGDHRAVEV